MTKTDFFRYCRLLHGWLSAFAFIALCFFSLTGLLLNHPEWLSGSARSVDKHDFALSASELEQLRAVADPSRLLVEFANQRIALKGSTDEGDVDADVVGDEVFLRTQGVRGESFLRANLRSGVIEVTVETAPTLSVLNELHRAERAGKGWRLAVDVIAIVLVAMSMVGYIIFLSMRGARLRTAIGLTLGSTLGLFLIFVYAVS